MLSVTKNKLADSAAGCHVSVFNILLMNVIIRNNSIVYIHWWYPIETCVSFIFSFHRDIQKHIHQMWTSGQYRRWTGKICVKICTKRTNDLYLHPVLCRIIPPHSLNPTHLVSIEIKSRLCSFWETTAYYALLPMLLFTQNSLVQNHSLIFLIRISAVWQYFIQWFVTQLIGQLVNLSHNLRVQSQMMHLRCQ